MLIFSRYRWRVISLFVPIVVIGCSPAPSQTTVQKSAAMRTAEVPPQQLSADAVLRELRVREARASGNQMDKSLAVASLERLSAEHLVQLYRERVKSIYGPDDRRDIWALTASPMDVAYRTASNSVVAICLADSVKDNNDRGADPSPLAGTSSLITDTFATRYRLCAGERFADQPVAAICSGSLVGDDLVLTAGHCVGTPDLPPNQLRIVFGFRMIDETKANVRIPNRDIYTVKEVVKRVYTPRAADWAIVRLDRKVEGHAVLHVARFDPASPDRRKQHLLDGAAVVAMGHPCGLPLKITPNATVQGNDVTQPFFVSNLDTFGGNSGSPVFSDIDGTLSIVGVLVRGLDDFKDFVAPTGSCRVAILYRDDEAGEACTRVEQFSASIP